MASEPSILIIGAGPTGLGAAWRLQELNHSRWQMAEAAKDVGGLAGSRIDPQGFTWDRGGHVLFSHYPYFDHLMDELLKDQWVEHIRESWVYMRQRFIAYPLQNNIWRLPVLEWLDCLAGLFRASLEQHALLEHPTFEQWMLQSFGPGIVKSFMRPYNWKVWAYSADRLSATWIQDRVATVQVGRILRNAILRREEKTWGPNARFRFPLRGGTGAIWKALYAKLPSDKIALDRALVSLSLKDRRAHFSDGSVVSYDHLISTIPLNMLLQRIQDRPDLAQEAKKFVYSSTHLVGVGVRGKVPKLLSTKCWMYFPEPEIPFYRATVFSNYSRFNVPPENEYWSLLCEVSESPAKPVNNASIVEEVITGLERTGFPVQRSDIVSLWHERLEHGYPTPFVGRDAILAHVDHELKQWGVWSRGRFGGWKYEVSNQDHSLMQGRETIDHWLQGGEEMTYYQSQVVNAPRSG